MIFMAVTDCTSKGGYIWVLQGICCTLYVRSYIKHVRGGHYGVKTNLHRIFLLFYRPSIYTDVKKWNLETKACQHNKSDHTLSPRLLKSLPIPYMPWHNISMDFIEGLPRSSGKNVIFIIVDCFTQYRHFLALAYPFTALLWKRYSFIISLNFVALCPPLYQVKDPYFLVSSGPNYLSSVAWNNNTPLLITHKLIVKPSVSTNAWKIFAMHVLFKTIKIGKLVALDGMVAQFIIPYFLAMFAVSSIIRL